MKTRKTAGTSIQLALSEFCGADDIITPDVDTKHLGRNIDKFYTNHPHPTITETKQFLGDEIWNSYFKFAFVRNPWDLVVSRYHWNRKGKDCSIEDFKSFLKVYCSDEAHFGPAHYFVNDLQQLYTSANGQMILDYVGKFENLKSDLEKICDKIGLPKLELPKKKNSYKPNYYKKYTQYYDEDSKSLVKKYFQEDIDMFEYQYNQKFMNDRIAPIITKDMLLSGGDNINGPSLIKVPDWVENPLGKYYLYFAHHQGKYIRLAYSDAIEGPYKIYEPGTLKLEQTPCNGHIASPDVHVDDEKERIIMYYHGDVDKGQKTFISFSKNGLDFSSKSSILGMFYFRVFKYSNKFYAIAKNGNVDGIVYEADDWEGKFKPIFNLIPNIRHTAVNIKDNYLYLFYSCIGDCPESIYVCKINMDTWEALYNEKVIKPIKNYEGVNKPLIPSSPGSSTLRHGGSVNELRDPCVYEENNNLYLLYSLAGEVGIGLAKLYNLEKK
jgi:hypothetical protein